MGRRHRSGLPVLVSLLPAASIALSACAAASPESPAQPPVPGPEAHCAQACAAALHACSPAQCARGCLFVLDKLVEREEAHVLACIARAAPAKCDDVTFAGCAARTGPYRDGGPPPPRPPSADDDL